MADVFPATTDPDSIDSLAELKVLEKCKTSLPEDWSVIHSLWIRASSTKRIAEIDFIVISDIAVLCLEIKGGTVFRRDDDGIWEFRTQRGRVVNESSEGPFNQVRKAFFDLEKHLKRSGFADLYKGVPWWYGVVTPECVMNIPKGDPEISEDQYCSEVQFDRDFTGYLKRLGVYAGERLRRKRIAGETHGGIAPVRREKIRKALKSSIGYVEGLGLKIHRLEREFGILTERQFHALHMAQSNPRIALIGGAGTGKTLLAYQLARQKAIAGSRVLFTCFNRKLADHLSHRARLDDGDMHGIEFANYHQLLSRLLNQAGLEFRVSEDWDQFNEHAYDFLVEAISKLDNFQPYDYLVIDESQDLMRPDYLEVLSSLLHKGLESGNWLVCLDREQTIFADNYDENCESNILRLSVKLTLDENIRNTRQVAAYTYGLSSIKTMPEARTDGDEPLIWYYSDPKDLQRQLKKQLNLLLGNLANSDGSPDSVCVLAARKEPFLTVVQNISSETIRHGQEFSMEMEEGKFCWSTVQGFKGLESDIVLLLGIVDLSKISDRRLLYVGASRAKMVLQVFLPKSQEDQVYRASPNILELLQNKRSDL